jgi:hypothetical protein
MNMSPLRPSPTAHRILAALLCTAAAVTSPFGATAQAWMYPYQSSQDAGAQYSQYSQQYAHGQTPQSPYATQQAATGHKRGQAVTGSTGYYSYAPESGYSSSSSPGFFGSLFGGGSRNNQATANYQGYSTYKPYSPPYATSAYDPGDPGSMFGSYSGASTGGFNDKLDPKSYITPPPPGLKQVGYPVEIFLSQGYGRFGDYTFQLLGGRDTQPTPLGTFSLERKEIDYFSKKYQTPMPYSIFFTDAHAIHYGALDVPSRGCIHVDYRTSQILYFSTIVGKTKIIIHG